MALANPTFTDRYISDGNTAILSLKNFYDTILVTDVDDREYIYRIPIADFFTKYRHQLEDTIEYYSVSETSFYKPKTVSLHIYDTTEMWLALLRLNNMRNITEFCEPIIMVYNPISVKNLINIFFKREGIVG